MSGGLKIKGLAMLILGTTAVIGVCSLAMLMPGIAHIVPKRHDIPPYEMPKRKRLIRQALRRLERRGLIKGFINDDGTECVRVTQRGQDEVLRYQLLSWSTTQPKKWDGKWRLVAFDIKETKKGTRERIRGLLRQLGFMRLQDSVWIYPYDCEEIIELMRAAFHTGDGAMYLICDRFPGDRQLCKKFKLP